MVDPKGCCPSTQLTDHRVDLGVTDGRQYEISFFSVPSSHENKIKIK